MEDFEYKGYKGSCELSQSDHCFYGKVLDIADLVSYEGENVREAELAFQNAVDDYLETKESIK